MLDLHAIKPQDISALNPSEWASFAGQLLAQINEQSKHIAAQAKRINSDAQAIKWRDAKIESITFQLARLKAWKFGAKTERMSAQPVSYTHLDVYKRQVHELAHLKERPHDKVFYQLCNYMEPRYHQLEFELRVYLTHLEVSGARLWGAAGVEAV